MKLVVQIPCFNEAETIAEVIAGIPRHIEGIEEVEILVIDDGSSDTTAEIALEAGADRVERHGRNRGLAAAFLTGLEAATRMGADVIVNTDGDNQYPGASIATLIAPVVDGRAEMTIGDRRTRHIDHVGPLKRILYAIGGFTVRRVSGTRVQDPPSGFRAMSREFALRAYLLSSFSYTIETIFLAADQRARVVEIPVSTNPPRRPSRLFTSLPQYVMSSAGILLRAFAMQRPMRVFTLLSVPFFLVGGAFISRFLYIYFSNDPTRSGHIQSLVLAAALIIVGTQTLSFGMLGELIRTNRNLIQDIRARVRKIELAQDDSSKTKSA